MQMSEEAEIISKRLGDILKEYKEFEHIGQGAQKMVYKAVSGDGDTVALKIGKYRSPNQLERLQREVDLLFFNSLFDLPFIKRISRKTRNVPSVIDTTDFRCPDTSV